MIEIAREKYPRARFWLGTGFQLAFESGFFDKVYIIAVLHHIPSEEMRLRFLKEAVRVLKSQGKLILTVWDLKEKEKGFSKIKVWTRETFFFLGMALLIAIFINSI